MERRTIIKGAAWSAPAMAVAYAAPAAAASVVEPPSCPTCIRPAVLAGGAWTAAVPVSGNRGTVSMTNVFGINATGCTPAGSELAFTYTVTQAQMTMSDGRSYTSQSGLGAGTGTLGAAGTFPGVFQFQNVTLPNGGSATRYTPFPTRLSVTVNITFRTPLGATRTCPYTLTWDLQGSGTGVVTFGRGTVNYRGTARAM